MVIQRLASSVRANLLCRNERIVIPSDPTTPSLTLTVALENFWTDQGSNVGDRRFKQMVCTSYDRRKHYVLASIVRYHSSLGALWEGHSIKRLSNFHKERAEVAVVSSVEKRPGRKSPGHLRITSLIDLPHSVYLPSWPRTVRSSLLSLQPNSNPFSDASSYGN